MLKKFLPTSLLGRTTLIILIPVLLLQIAVSIVFFERHWSKMTERLAYGVTREMLATANLIEEALVSENSEERIEEIRKSSVGLDVVYYKDIQNKPEHDFVYLNKVFDNPFETIEEDLTEQLTTHSGFKFDIVTVPLQKLVIVDLYLSDGVLVFEIPEGRLFSSSSYIFILWMIGLSVLLFTISMLFMRNQIRPIYRLGVTAERLGRGIPVGRIKPSGAREVRQAAEAFINMQNRINQFVDQRTTMLAAVSHDLRTPLTRMKLQLEMLDDGEDKDALKSDINDMEQMIQGYLAFSKGDEGEEMQRLQLGDVCTQITDDARRLGLDVRFDPVSFDMMFIWAKPQALRRVFDNILSNAKRYASTVNITCHVEKNGREPTAIFMFDDNGPGVPDDQISELTKPFYRGEGSRNKKTGGVGLGLAIAHDIISAHGGTLNFEKSADLGGLKVIIRLPL